MKIYDISQEVFNCQIYPSDPIPEKKILKSMEKGETYNLTSFYMCAHNGTHIDAPFHFIIEKSAVIYGADYIRSDQWECCQELSNSYYKIIDEYIKSTDEFKSLPENTIVYE